MKLGYSEAQVVEKRLTDGSLVYSVAKAGDYFIEFHCTDRQAAENLASVIDFSVIGIDVHR